MYDEVDVFHEWHACDDGDGFACDDGCDDDDDDGDYDDDYVDDDADTVDGDGNHTQHNEEGGGYEYVVDEGDGDDDDIDDECDDEGSAGGNGTRGYGDEDNGYTGYGAGVIAVD